MAADLVHASPVFHKAVQACAAAVKPFGLDLLAEFDREDGWSHPAAAIVGLATVQVRMRKACQVPVLRATTSAAAPAFMCAQHWGHL